LKASLAILDAPPIIKICVLDCKLFLDMIVNIYY
jgi:hypothetical protein